MTNQAAKTPTNETDGAIDRASAMPDDMPWMDRLCLAAGAACVCWFDSDGLVEVERWGASPMAGEVEA